MPDFDVRQVGFDHIQRIMMNKRKLVVVLLALVALIGAGTWFMRRAEAGTVAPYRLAEVRRGTVEATVSSTGRLTAIQSVAVGTQVSGQVIELRADYNDRVRAGELIARIDPTIQEQSLRNAEANLERVRAALIQAERDYERNQKLHEQQVITEAEFNDVEYSLTVARANLTSAEVSVEQARRNLDYTEIYSPIDGVVVERNVEPGQTVAASMSAPQLYLLATELENIEILADVSESDIGVIRNGMPVRFTVDAYDNTTFSGVVRQVRLASATQENVVNYTAVISVKNDDLRLVPGMTATVDFIVQQAEDVLLVPNAAVRLRPSEEMIAQLTDSSMIAIARGESTGAVDMRRRTGGAGGAAQGGGGRRANVGGRSNVPADARTDGAVLTDATAEGGTGDAERSPADDRVFVLGGGASARESGPPTFAPLWYTRDGQLGVMLVRTGIAGQMNTEVSAPNLEEGTEVVVGLATPQTEAAGGTTNPFGGGGGFGGGPGMVRGGGFGR